MCGIFGSICFDTTFSREDYSKFVNATNKVSYRGPDGYGFKCFNLFNQVDTEESFNIFLGHRRLSIIDLSASAAQPMVSNGNFIIYNGEIFNYVELKNELISRGVRFDTSSDTEVILKVYENYGTLGFEKLNGMWAFIILDTSKKKLILSRDRFSIKPLYWLKQGKKYYFASEIKQLLDFLSSKSLNKTVMSRLLYQGILDMDNQTFYEGIESLESKHNYIINIRTGEIQKERYWNYNRFQIDKSDAIGHFKELFYDSVRIRLRSDVELGGMLSGGLDSSAISLISKNILGDSFKTYTVVSNNQKYSEEKYSDILVKNLNLKNEKLFISSDEVIKNINKAIRQQDEPFINFIVVANYSILQKIKKETDITVVLNGQGGDEVLAGYLRFYFFYLKYLLKERNYPTLIFEILGALLNRTILYQWNIAGAKRYLPSLMTKEIKFIRINKCIENTFRFKDMFETQQVNIDNYSIPIHTRYEDRNSMAHSLEIRLPFLDHRLIEFALSVPTSLKINKGWNKYILRKSLPELPRQIRWRRDKKGFILPEALWLKKDFFNDIVKSFQCSKLDEYGIINSNLFLDYYHSYLAGNKKIHNFDISRVYIAEKWMQECF